MSIEPLDVVDFVVNQGHGVRGLSAMGLAQVPSKYVQPPEEQFEASKVLTDESIPEIDVSDMDNDLTRSSLCDAAALYGVFYVVNHGIPLEVMEKLQSAAHRFFELPTEEKVKYKTEYEGAKLGTSFNHVKEKVMEWKDFLSHRFTTDEEAASQTWPPFCR